jgi:hypothetical protein
MKWGLRHRLLIALNQFHHGTSSSGHKIEVVRKTEEVWMLLKKPSWVCSWAKLKADGPTFSKQSVLVGPGQGRLPLSFLHPPCITSSLLSYAQDIVKASALEIP